MKSRSRREGRVAEMGRDWTPACVADPPPGLFTGVCHAARVVVNSRRSNFAQGACCSHGLFGSTDQRLRWPTKKGAEPKPDAWEAGAWLPGRQKRDYQTRSFLRARCEPHRRRGSIGTGPVPEAHNAGLGCLLDARRRVAPTVSLRFTDRQFVGFRDKNQRHRGNRAIRGCT